MAESIDSLQIEINAQAVKANQSIDLLVNKIDKLTTSMNHLDGSRLAILANGVQRLGTAMQTMNTVKTADFTRLANNLQKLNNIDVSKLSSVSANINHIGTAFKGLNGVSQGAKEITELANGIKQLGYKSADKAITNIPLLADAMKKLMSELSTAPRVSRNLIDMTNALAKLARTGASSGTAANSLAKSFNRVSVASKGLKINLLGAVTGFKSLGRQLLSAVGLAGGLYAVFNGIKKSINIASDLTEVQNVVDVTFGDFKKKIEDLSKISIPTLGISELETKQTASRFQAMGTAMGFAQGKMSNMSVELTKLSADMASFYNVEQKAVAEDLESVFTGQTRPLRTYGLDLTQATLQEWALKNGLDANIKSMSQAEKTMLRYQYVMANTGAAQGDFLRTQDTWANQVRILTYNLQQLGSVIGGTLINAFKPLLSALNTVIGKFISFAETVSNALGKIFGWKYESGGGGATGLADDMESASGSAGGIAKNTGKAAKNIEKMKAGLRAFDELKTISMPDNNSGSGSGSGGSGGSGGGGASSGSGGQWKKQKTIFEDYQSSIDSLYELGEYVKKTIQESLDKIDWDSVYQSADKFGTGLASYLNGLFSGKKGETLFASFGTTIASTLNTVLHGLDSFGKTFEWEQFGLSLSDGINKFSDTFDVDLAASGIHTWIKGVLKTASTLLKETDFEKIGNKIGEFLKGLKFIEITGDLAGAIWEAIKSAFSLVKGIFEEAPLESSLISAFAVLKFTGLGNKVASAASKAIGEKLQTISISKVGVTIAALVVAVEAIKWDIDIGKEIYNASKEQGLNGGSILDDAISEMQRDIVKGDFKLSLPFDLSLPSVNELGLGKWWEKMVKQTKNIGEIFLKLKKPGKKTVENVISKTLGIVENVAKGALTIPLKLAFTKQKNVKKLVETEFEAVSNAAGKIVQNIKIPFSIALSSWDDIKDKVTSWANGIKKKIEESGSLGKAVINFSAGFNVTTKMSSLYSAVREKWNAYTNGKTLGIGMKIVTTAKTLWKTFKSAWDKAVGMLNLKIKTPHLTIKWDTKTVLGKDFKYPKGFDVKYYKAGGFPSKASLFWAGEDGIPEMMGTVGGKSAVAGGAEITGIREEIRTTANEEIVLLKQQNALLQAILRKDYGISVSDIGKAAQQYSRDYLNRTGRPAYDF